MAEYIATFFFGGALGFMVAQIIITQPSEYEMIERIKRIRWAQRAKQESDASVMKDVEKL